MLVEECMIGSKICFAHFQRALRDEFSVQFWFNNISAASGSFESKINSIEAKGVSNRA